MIIAGIGLICFFCGTILGMIITALMTNSKMNEIYDNAGRLQSIPKDKSDQQ